MKILVSAYACETGRGSEGEIGWRLILRLAKNNDVWVITRANLRGIHEAAFRETPKPERLHFVYFDLPWIFRFYKKGARFFLLYYYLWQIGVGLQARRLARQIDFDVLHHLIGGMDWMPAGLALVPGRFIWGPVGSENTHPAIWPYLSKSSQRKDRIRTAIRWFMRHVDPFVRLTGARAETILTHTIETMPRRYAAKLRPFVQTGIENSPTLAQPKTNLDRSDIFQIVYAGELKDWKGARFALEAALRFFETDKKSVLRLIGDGPLKRELEATAAAHPEGHRVTFLGRIPMDALVKELNAGDVFLYPSFHHGLATIILQAMLTGVPIVCIEGDATGRAVGSKAGISVELSEKSEPAIGLANALHHLAQNEPDRQRLAIAAREMAANDFNYDHLGDKLLAVFETRSHKG